MKYNVEKALKALMGMLTPMYGAAVRNVVLEHVDEAGYWFKFELAQDSRRQTWCVRHSDLEG